MTVLSDKEKYVAFVLDVFENDANAGLLTVRLLREKYLKHAELESLPKDHQQIFSKAVEEGYKLFEKRKAKSDTDDLDVGTTARISPKKRKPPTSEVSDDNLKSTKRPRKGTDVKESSSDEEPLVTIKKESAIAKNPQKNDKQPLKKETKNVSSDDEPHYDSKRKTAKEPQQSAHRDGVTAGSSNPPKDSGESDAKGQDEPESKDSTQLTSSNSGAVLQTSDISDEEQISDTIAGDISREIAKRDSLKSSKWVEKSRKNGDDEDSSENERSKNEDENEPEKSELSDDSDATEAKKLVICKESEGSSEDEPLADLKTRLKHKSSEEESDLGDEKDSNSGSKRRRIGTKPSGKSKTARRESSDKDDQNSTAKKARGDDDHPKIAKLKRYVRLAGIRVVYSKLFEGCNSVKSKLAKLFDLLEEAGLRGKPTIEKCKKLHKKRDALKEAAELDRSNILQATQGRTRRNTRTQSLTRSLTPPSPEASPPAEAAVPVAKQMFSRLKGIVDSEESGSD